MSIFKVLSIFVFAFTCHQNAFPVVNELRNPTQSRVNSVLFGAIGTAFTVFMIVVIAAFSTYGSDCESNVLKSYPELTVTTIARIFISILVSFTYPLQCNPSRRSILNMIRYFVDKGEEINPKIFYFRYILVTTLFLIGSFGIAFAVSDLGVVLALVGATGSTIVSYILPGGFYYILHKDDTDKKSSPKWKLYLALLQFSVGCVLIPTCLTFIFMGAGGE